ncbi:MAG: MarR family transcriptional regulator, partial [Alphaproteobacteria bacterium]|nr:MarR family transcriptional regulator [Alphaproteobacteria bacterium]
MFCSSHYQAERTQPPLQMRFCGRGKRQAHASSSLRLAARSSRDRPAMNTSDAIRLAHLTADLMMVNGRMKRSALHSDRELLHPGTEFAILDTIERHRCRTVPEIAAWRGVARQSVQAAVNKLIEASLVEQHDNPSHKLSSLL